MRDKQFGKITIDNILKSLEQKHNEHIDIYGADLNQRLTGDHETCDIHTFKSGDSDRGASIRIPISTAKNGYGYIEDRRPGANSDPYLVAAKILSTICEIETPELNKSNRRGCICMSNELIEFTLSNIWILICTVLVFSMHLGFACLEAGLTRSKNTINILFKNFGVVSIGIISYAVIGFQLMYPQESFMGLFGISGLGISSGECGLTPIIIQIIIIGLTLFSSYVCSDSCNHSFWRNCRKNEVIFIFIFTIFLVGVFYPLIGMWHWGGGILSQLAVPFYDFAGSSIVHSVGGWAALVAVLMIGPRIGKYKGDKILAIKPHSFILAAIGVFLLWFGWFGFNGGSVLSADVSAIALVFVITALGGACRNIIFDVYFLAFK